MSFVSCGSKDEPEAKVPFKVVSTTPPDGAIGVSLNTVVKIVFSKKIVFDAKCFGYYAIMGNKDLLWSISYDNDKTVSITFSGRGLVKNDDVYIGMSNLKSVDDDVLQSYSECGTLEDYKSFHFYTVK